MLGEGFFILFVLKCKLFDELLFFGLVFLELSFAEVERLKSGEYFLLLLGEIFNPVGVWGGFVGEVVADGGELDVGGGDLVFESCLY